MNWRTESSVVEGAARYGRPIGKQDKGRLEWPGWHSENGAGSRSFRDVRTNLNWQQSSMRRFRQYGPTLGTLFLQPKRLGGSLPSSTEQFWLRKDWTRYRVGQARPGILRSESQYAAHRLL